MESSGNLHNLRGVASPEEVFDDSYWLNFSEIAASSVLASQSLGARAPRPAQSSELSSCGAFPLPDSLRRLYEGNDLHIQPE